MSEWTLRLPYDKPPLSLNDRSRSPWRRIRITHDLVHQVRYLAIAQEIPRCERVRVTLAYTPATHRRRDQDNLVATLKPCIDGLRRADVIPDDTPEHVEWVVDIRPVDRANSRVELIVERLA